MNLPNAHRGTTVLLNLWQRMTETPSESAQSKSPRKISIDVYRGMVMFLMLAEMMHLSRLARHFPGNQLMEWLRFHTSHVAWEGCSLHDLIQPGFTFLVGVAMPFSIAARIQRGNLIGMLMHAAWRAVILILLGIVLRSLNSEQTYFTFEDTLTQIGLGYFFVFLIALLPRWVHYLSAVMILFLVWLAFALSPAPPEDFDYRAVGVSERWTHHDEGFASRWNKNSNLAWQADGWFLNLFPRETPFVYNSGGYATLSFVPTIVTMLIGLIAGVWLREPLERKDRMLRFALGTAICLLSGWLLAYSDLCPLVKRIWTPSFTLWSGGWCLAWLAALHWVCDVKGFQRWAFPFMVIGANSILIYVMSWTVERPIRDLLLRHFGEAPFAIFGPEYVTQVSGVATLAIMFYVLLWLYRRKVFIRI
jgi:heparan-alpha-glucosaminide N-acetyltransferase